jgi:NAD(P)-dependent dehydrogenase (short-subunit alcohol dehydrogenase family)
MQMNKTIFITGASSGLGRLTAKHFARQGWKVAATMRTPEKETEFTEDSNIRVFMLDVTSPEQAKTATAHAIAEFGRIDVVVNSNVRGPIHHARA